MLHVLFLSTESNQLLGINARTILKSSSGVGGGVVTVAQSCMYGKKSRYSPDAIDRPYMMERRREGHSIGQEKYRNVFRF